MLFLVAPGSGATCTGRQCRTAQAAPCRAACQHRARDARWRRVARPYWSTFTTIAQCESHRHWRLRPYGGLGFMPSSWRAFHGRGVASSHSRLEQIYRAVLVMHRYGWNAWPVCRHHAGV